MRDKSWGLAAFIVIVGLAGVLAAVHSHKQKSRTFEQRNNTLTQPPPAPAGLPTVTSAAPATPAAPP